MFKETNFFVGVIFLLIIFISPSIVFGHNDCMLDLDSPIITCSDSDTASVVFFWDPIPGASNYLITVTSGQAFSLTGTTLTIDGLAPGELVTIEVQAVSASGELSPVVEASCSALLCMTADINISAISTICFPDTSGMLTSLDVQVISNSGGVGLWSGPGLVNSTQGIFDPNLVGPGDYTVLYSFISAGCTNLDSITIRVRDEGFANFDSPLAICVTDTAHITFTGIAPEGSTFNWDFGAGHEVSVNPDNSVDAYWDNPSSQFIGLNIDNDGCASNLHFANIDIDMPLDTPDVGCNPTFSDVEFIWDPVENANTYVVNVINGPLGIQTSDTSYLLPNLIPGQEFGIRLLVVSDNACPGNIQLPVCYTTYCPEVVDLVEPIGPFCFDALEVPDTIQLVQNLPDTIGFASGVWHGNGIIDSIAGILVVDQSMVGINEVYIDYVEDVCSFSDTLVFEVISDLVADFSLPDSICIVDTLTVEFSGSAPLDAVYEWDFGTDAIVDGTGQGPFQVIWGSGGEKEVKVKVSYTGCNPDSMVQTIQVMPPPTPPAISCVSSPSEILFSWATIDGAMDNYPVTVLQGGAGTSLSDTSIIFNNLNPFDTIRIQVEALSLYNCADTLSILECVAVECPDISIQATPVDPICFSMDTTLMLEAMVSGNTGGNGSTYWEGDEITDSENGVLTITNAAVGQTLVAYAVYEEGPCIFRDTLEIDILKKPIASFSMPDTICITDEASIVFDGEVDANATYNWIWNFDGGVPVSGMNDGPYSIKWNNEGLHTVSLKIEGNCHSTLFEKDIFVSSPLSPVLTNCTAAVDSITVSWPTIPGATSYHIEILEGLPFVMTSDTSIVVSGLMPEQTVNFSFYPNTGDVCGYIPYDFTCQTLPCPSYLIEVQEIADYCFNGQLDTLLPSIQSNTDLSVGISNWSGANLLDINTGLFEINANSTLQTNELFYTYTEGFCTYKDTLLYKVNPTPIASFTGVDSICSSDNTFYTFTGNANINDTYNWVFPGGTIISGSGAGPYEVAWGASGNYEISLVVENENCTSDPFLFTQNVDEPLPEMQVDCSAGLDSIWVSWNDYPLVNGYFVEEAGGLAFVYSSDTSIVFSGLAEGQTVNVSITPNFASKCDLPTGQASCTTISCGDANISWSAAPICEGEADAEILFNSNTTWTFDVFFEDENGNTYVAENVMDGSVFPLTISETSTFSITQIVNKTVALCQLDFPENITIEVHSIAEAGMVEDEISLCEGAPMSIILMDQIDGFVPGGIWQESSSVLSNGFDANNGTLQTELVQPGSYSFLYQLESPAPCPAGAVTVDVVIHPKPTVNAGADVQLGCNLLSANLGDNTTSQGSDFIYSWTSAGGTDIADPTQLFIQVMDDDTYTLHVENTSTGCQAEDEVTVTSNIDFPELFLGMEPVSCFGEEDGFVKVDSVKGGLKPYSYSFEGGTFSNQLVYGPLPQGNYQVIVKDNNGCETTENITLTGGSNWQLELETNLSNDENVIQLGEQLTLEALIGLPESQIDSIYWIPDTLTHISNSKVTTTPFITSTYRVIVRDENGCTQEDFVTVYVDRKRDVYIPMAFSPNDDGVNDIFMIYAGAKVRKVNHLFIFNRWGELLFKQANFQANDPNYGWDGRLNGQTLNNGVFIYSAEVEMIDGEVVLLTGDITLIR